MGLGGHLKPTGRHQFHLSNDKRHNLVVFRTHAQKQYGKVWGVKGTPILCHIACSNGDSMLFCASTCSEGSVVSAHFDRYRFYASSSAELSQRQFVVVAPVRLHLPVCVLNIS